MIVMAGKTSGDSSRRVPGIIFPGIQDSFTTQGLPSKAPSGTDSPATAGPGPGNPDLLKLKSARTCESSSTHDNRPAGGTT
jgi:hypothetical protein